MKYISVIAVSIWMSLANCLVVADTVIDEKFTTSTLPDSWKIFGGAVETGGGMLLLKTEGRAIAASYYDHQQQLNFARAPIEIELSNLDVKGTTASESGIFMLFLCDNIKNQLANTSIQLRIPRSGKITLTIYTMSVDGGAPSGKRVISTLASLPISKLTLALNSKMATLAFQDSSGTHTESANWEQPFDPSIFDKPALYLQLHAVSKNDPGTTEVSLKHLKVISGVTTAKP